jgi:hypothetical protein
MLKCFKYIGINYTHPHFKSQCCTTADLSEGICRLLEERDFSLEKIMVYRGDRVILSVITNYNLSYSRTTSARYTFYTYIEITEL